MNALCIEVYNILHSRGKDDWTVKEIGEAIYQRREDVSALPNPNQVRAAAKVLYDAGKATRREVKDGSVRYWIYTATVPDIIDDGHPLKLAWRTVKSMKYRWIAGISITAGSSLWWSLWSIMEGLK